MEACGHILEMVKEWEMKRWKVVHGCILEIVKEGKIKRLKHGHMVKEWVEAWAHP